MLHIIGASEEYRGDFTEYPAETEDVDNGDYLEEYDIDNMLKPFLDDIEKDLGREEHTTGGRSKRLTMDFNGIQGNFS